MFQAAQEDIQCEEQLVRVRFLIDVPWTDLLCVGGEEMDDISSSSANMTNGKYDHSPSSAIAIGRGTVLEQPLWLARPLSEAGVVAILPLSRAFGSKVRADLAAGADHVSMRDLAPHWYRLGLKIGPLLPAEGVTRLLSAALSARLPLILRLSQSEPLPNYSLIHHSIGNEMLSYDRASQSTFSAASDPHLAVFADSSAHSGATGVSSPAVLDAGERRILNGAVAARADLHKYLSQEGQQVLGALAIYRNE